MSGSLPVQVELPSEVLDDFGSAEAVAEHLRRFAVLDLVKRRKISRGKAAELLGVSYHDLLDLMAEWDIPAFDLTAEELDQEIAVARAATLAARTAQR
ncbi:MAG: UPF0175 family protein [Chloroflexota bacterium]|nr:UPF0175 family protein [Chloroflexota bacterium]